MTADEHIDRLLRRGADEVRTTVVHRTSPPPIEVFERSHQRWVTAASLVIVLAGLAGLVALVHGHDDEAAPPTVSVPVTQAASLCADIANATAALATPPTRPADWQIVASEVRVVSHRVQGADLGGDGTRRLERFVLLAGLAVERGVNGEQLTAASRAEEAVAVGRDLVGFLAVPGCTLSDLSASASERTGG